MNAPRIDELIYIGQFSNPNVNNGCPLPLYESAPRADGRPDINTVEGWNRMRHDFAARALHRRLGREPGEAEIQTEMKRNATEARNMIEMCNAAGHEKEEAAL